MFLDILRRNTQKFIYSLILKVEDSKFCIIFISWNITHLLIFFFLSLKSIKPFLLVRPKKNMCELDLAHDHHLPIPEIDQDFRTMIPFAAWTQQSSHKREIGKTDIEKVKIAFLFFNIWEFGKKRKYCLGECMSKIRLKL